MDERRGLVEELHKPARRLYPRRKFEVRGLDETWQADLVDMQAYAGQNKGYKYLLTVIDVFSKYAWAVPIKSKEMGPVSSAFKSILNESGRKPINLQVDQGSEFYNKEFQSLLKKYKIYLYSSFSNLKASIIERFNRTLKTWMWKEFTYRMNGKWYDILPTLMEKYNDRVHRTIGKRPSEVSKANEKLIAKKFILPKLPKRRKKTKYQIGDKVRLSRYKHVFEKSYTPQWTNEIFTIRNVAQTNPVTYHLLDSHDEKVLGGFYNEELAKVKYPLYLIEKVIKKRGKMAFVKWYGFDNTENQWIPIKDIV